MAVMYADFKLAKANQVRKSLQFLGSPLPPCGAVFDVPYKEQF